MEPVRTHRSGLVVEAALLHRSKERRRRGLTLIEGPHLLEDARRVGIEPITVFTLEAEPANGALPVDQRAMQRLAGTASPRGPVAVIEIPQDQGPGQKDLIVACGLTDPGNVGTMIRTAAAFGWAFGYTEGTADPWSPKTLRAGAGGQFQTPIGPYQPIDIQVTVAAVPRGGVMPSEIGPGQIALLIGEEASGLDPHLAKTADVLVTIPTSGPTESLNAAVAAGILIAELSRRGGGPGSV